ncbi:hypothetical protein [Cochlodiniinecator piscidefendens]|uniref:hypothetical protein n=1 Tax=Cochlodiniinecator piscidefendens TaxID=2715756 RepID=UPI00197B592D|nr:hypothetical protein [Cochlodiniinecator piscidefendens]
MYDPTFGSTTISRQINKHDFRKIPNLTNENFRNSQVTRAVAVAKAGLGSTSLSINDLAGRKIYNISDYPTELVLRKACQNIRKITGAKQGSRVEIVRRLRALCTEGCPFTLAKLDIKSFYPSVDAEELTSEVKGYLPSIPACHDNNACRRRSR